MNLQHEPVSTKFQHGEQSAAFRTHVGGGRTEPREGQAQDPAWPSPPGSGGAGTGALPTPGSAAGRPALGTTRGF